MLGRNGAGKTTLMRVMAGILAPVSGRVLLNGTDLAVDPAAKDDIGYLGHRPALSSDLTVRRNLEFWAALYCPGPALRSRRLAEVRELFTLDALWEKRAARLSRGQLQRVDLARVVLADPVVVLLDEPMTGLDPVTSALVRELIRDWSRTKAVLYSTHNVPEALTVASQVLILKDGTLSTRNDLVSGGSSTYEIVCAGPWPQDVAPARTAEGGLVRVEVPSGSTLGELIAVVVGRGVPILDVRRTTVDADAVLREILEDRP
nr:ABC transporter ATP-binding protein [Kitasatospora sp. MAP5-34]